MDTVLFNRVPQAGSELLMNLINDLKPVNKFKVFRKEHGDMLRQFSLKDQDTISEDVAVVEDSSFYISSLQYINFTEYDFPRPIYINMIRDPVDRVISWYNYIRTPEYIAASYNETPEVKLPPRRTLKTSYASCVVNKHKECVYMERSKFLGEIDYKRQMINFCGYDQAVCVPFNSLATLQTAKKNVEADYAVIGTWEDTNVTLSVFEHYIPKYFKGATSKYYEVNKSNDTITEQTELNTTAQHIKNIVRKSFQREIEFYEFCRQRLYKQYLALNLEK